MKEKIRLRSKTILTVRVFPLSRGVPSFSGRFSCNSVADLDEEEVQSLLRKRTTVNTITIAVDKGNGELWYAKSGIPA